MEEINPTAARQYIDAVATFEAWEEARQEAAQVRGGMYWHAGPSTAPQARYLVRTTPAGAETSLGPQTLETQAMYDRFMQRKQESTERMAGLKAALDQHRRLNRALRVGRVEPLVVNLLVRLADTQLSPHFRVVGTHALYAYEAAAGVRLDAGALATRDIDLLWDTRKRIQFATQLARVDSRASAKCVTAATSIPKRSVSRSSVARDTPTGVSSGSIVSSIVSVRGVMMIHRLSACYSHQRPRIIPHPLTGTPFGTHSRSALGRAASRPRLPRIRHRWHRQPGPDRECCAASIPAARGSVRLWCRTSGQCPGESEAPDPRRRIL